MTIFKVYKLCYDYELEKSYKEYLTETFADDKTAKEVCEIHKKIDGGIYRFETFEISKVYKDTKEYKTENKIALLNKRYNHLLNHCYSFELLQADDFGCFELDSVDLCFNDMNKIIKAFENSNKKSVRIYNCFNYLIKVMDTDLPAIVEKHQEIEKELNKINKAINANNNTNNV